MNDEEIRKIVRERYAEIATMAKSPESACNTDCCSPQEISGESCCCSPQEMGDVSSCCSPQEMSGVSCCCSPQEAMSRAIGYTDEELGAIPDGANLGLGCGNPTALASLMAGEVVLDLGSGGGVDCFLAANVVGKSGRVIGVDMTPEMLATARGNARKSGYENVEFRLGEIENLPVADSSIDAIISNCVINLSPDKDRVFRESYRVLKPGGRVMVSDIVLLKELPEFIKNSIEAYAGCIAGASRKEKYIGAIEAAGFRDVKIISEVSMGGGELAGTIASINVRAVKAEVE